jgi:hypothetical protein
MRMPSFRKALQHGRQERRSPDGHFLSEALQHARQERRSPDGHERPCFSHPLRGRLRSGLCLRRRRPAGAGGLAETVRQVRLDPASGQDAADAVPTPTAADLVHGLLAGRPTWVFRPTRLHPLLGPFAAWAVGGEAEDGPRPLEPRPPDDGAVVSPEPTPTDRRAAPNAGPETAWPLCLLRNHGQRPCVAAVPGGGGAHLEEVAVTPTTAWLPLLDDLRPVAAPLCASAAGGRSFSVSSRQRTRDLTSRMP